DTAKIDEDAVDPAEGNVLDNDDLGADDPHTVEFDGIVPGDTHTGEYGTFTYNEDGTWIYTLDNTDPRVQGLKGDEILTESFDYTVTEADGDSSTATLTITIKGQTDAPPVIDIEDADLDATDAHNSVVEGTGDTVTGEISVSADAGIADVTVGGHSILDLAGSPVAITTGEGTLTITSYDADTGTITYSYEENGQSSDHTDGDDSVVDKFEVVVTDNEGDDTSSDLTIQIIDTAPEAAPDTAKIDA